MEVSRKPCRLCLAESDFNVSLYGDYCRKTSMIDKILICLKIVVEKSDYLNTICYKCAGNVENYHEFITFIQKSQTKLGNNNYQPRQISLNKESPTNHVKHHVTSYVRQQVFDGDITFSFMEASEEKKEEDSMPFFSYLSPPNQQSNGSAWKSRSLQDRKNRYDKFQRPRRSEEASQQRSRDLFESQSQDVNEADSRSLDWKLTPGDDSMIKRIKDKCFGRSNI